MTLKNHIRPRYKRPLLTMLILAGIAGGGCKKELSAEEYFASAEAFYEAGDTGRARVQLRNALREDPNMAKAYYYLALIGEAQGKVYNAYADIQRALELAPNDPAIQTKAAEYFLLTAQFSEARELAQQALQENSDNAVALNTVVAAHIGLQEYKLALKAAEQGNSDNTDLMALKAVARKFTGDYAQASTLVATLIQREPEQINHRLLALELAQLQNDQAAQFALLQYLTEKEPGNERFALAQARLLLQNGQTEQAIQQLKRFNRNNPGNIAVKNALLQLMQSHAPEQMQAQLDTFLQQTPEDSGLQLMQASRLLQNSQTAQARALLARLAEAEATDAALRTQAQLMLAKLALSEGDIAAASEQIDRLLAGNMYHIEARLLAARIALLQSQAKMALEHLQLLEVRDPANVPAYLLKAQAYGLMGEHNEQIRNYEHYLAAQPQDFAARDTLTGLYIEQGKFHRAEQLLQGWPKSARQEGIGLRQLQLALAQKHWSDAQKHLKASWALTLPDWQRAYFQARIDAGSQRRNAALEGFKKAIEAQPDFLATYEALRANLTPADYPATLNWLQKLTQQSPRAVPAYLLQAHIYRDQGDTAGTIQALNTGLKNNPDWVQGYKLLADQHLAQNNKQRALATLKQGLTQVPDDAFLLANLASAQEAAGHYSQAAETYEALLQLQPNSLVVKNNYALLLVNPDTTANEQNLKKALQLVQGFTANNSPALLDTYGWVIFRNGDHKAAVTYLRRAYNALPHEPEVAWHYASALAANEEKAQALEVVEKALGEKAPPAAREKLEAMQQSLRNNTP